MTEQHMRIYREGLQLTKTFKTAERGLVENFIQAEDSKIYREFDKPSMFQYATEVLGHSESMAYTLIHVARSAKRVPEFRKAVAANKLSIAKAGRIAAHVEKNNTLIEFAATHSKRETEIEVAKLNPEADPVNRVKIVDYRNAQVTVTISHGDHFARNACGLGTHSIATCTKRNARNAIRCHRSMRPPIH